MLSTHHRTRVTVSEEMSFLESYIHILTLKYNNFLERLNSLAKIYDRDGLNYAKHVFTAPADSVQAK